MKHLDFFSGIGGFALACQWAGIDTIGFVEIDKYCQKVLRKHWPDVPIVEDIRDVEKIKEIVANAQGGVIKQHGQTRESINGEGRTRMEPVGRNSRRADILLTESSNKSSAILITAGFPCQPFSVAGKRGSTEDDRYLWPETIAVIKAVKPSWVLLENVTGIINLALDTVLSDLEGAGYATETLIIPACAVNAWHRRDRVWIVGFTNELRLQEQRIRPMDNESQQPGQDVANTQREGLERADTERDSRSTGQPLQSLAYSRLLGQAERELQTTGIAQCDWWAVEPELGRVAHGIPARVDRLKCLGNAIVPQVAYEIIKVIAMTGARHG